MGREDERVYWLVESFFVDDQHATLPTPKGAVEETATGDLNPSFMRPSLERNNIKKQE
jgi:hypothetical protein